MVDIQQLFLERNLRSTKARIAILSIISSSDSAMSHMEILDRLAGEKEIDRVTVYRVLDWLTEHGLIHRISGENRAWKFQFSLPSGQDASTQVSGIRYSQAHQHAHLHCSQCGNVTCLHEFEPQVPQELLEKYQVNSVDVNLRGICKHCLSTSSAV